MPELVGFQTMVILDPYPAAIPELIYWVGTGYGVGINSCDFVSQVSIDINDKWVWDL